MKAIRSALLSSCVLIPATLPLHQTGHACEAMIGAEYSDPPEVMRLELDPEAWHTVFRTRDAGGARKEWVPADETLNRWTQLVTWRLTFGESRYSLTTGKEYFLRQVANICPDVKSKVIEKSDDELVFEWWHSDCYGRDAQYHITRLRTGATGTHHLGYSRKGEPLTGSERDQWVERLSGIPLEIAALPPEGKRGPIDRARLAIWSGDYAEAVAKLEPLAKSGNADAQEELARLYYEGWGVQGDREKTIEWLRKAASQDQAAAHYQLGRMYENGWGVDKDEAQARSWFESAAKLGDPEAQGRIGYLLANDSEPDYAEAAKWLRKSADEGHYHALFWLGRMHEEGWGMEKDVPEAIGLYKQLAVLGEPDAQYRIGLAYREGRGVEADPAQAAKWLERAAVQGSQEARELYYKEYAPPDVRERVLDRVEAPAS